MKEAQIDIEKTVKERYAEGAEEKQAALCCPVTYDPKFLEVIPEEILEKDYGCGDPSQFLLEGDTVLDLGSGGGKICYIASQVVGENGKVIGVDFNPAMLSLANKYKKEIANKIGWGNVEFRRGKIQDLKTNLDLVEEKIKKQEIKDLNDYLDIETEIRALQNSQPLIEDDSIDVIVSNCVLNLVESSEKKKLFKEMFRVLKRGGRVAISDIVSDEEVPTHLQNDPELWSGCISGAFEEKAFIKAFEEVGFYGVKIEKRDDKPWQTVEGIEFRSVTITAYKGKEGACWERNQAVVYKGPWKQVCDDDGHVIKRGERVAVCDKTFQIYKKAPYKNEFYFIEPYEDIPLEKAKEFNCRRTVERHPKETKGMDYKETSSSVESCGDTGCC